MAISQDFRKAFEATDFGAVDTTEFDTKKRELAEFLCKMATGLTIAEMDDVDHEVSENYILDAEDVMISMPHLLSYGQRESLNLI